MGRSSTEWTLDPDKYTVEEVANRAVELLFTELYSPIIGDQLDQHDQANTARIARGEPALAFDLPVLGFVVAGYSAESEKAEAWQIIISDPRSSPMPINIAPKDAYGHVAFAQPEDVERLFGVHSGLKSRVLAQVDPSTHPALEDVFSQATYDPAVPFMPFADAINLARFLVDVTNWVQHILVGPKYRGRPG
jgi:hypothetical protein